MCRDATKYCGSGSKYHRTMFVSIQNDYTGIEASIMFRTVPNIVWV